MEDRSYVRKMTITPQMAKDWLETSIGNRRLNKARVEQIARDIYEGKIVTSNDMITFTEDGVLVNGHHRLNACIKANKPFATYVLFDAPKESVERIDTNQSRSVTDIIAVGNAHNGTNYCQATNCASCVRVLLTFKRTNGTFVNARHKMWFDSQNQVIDFIKRNYEKIITCIRIIGGKKAFRSDLRYPTSHAAAIYVAAEAFKIVDIYAKTDQLYRDVTSQIGLKNNTIQYAFLKKMKSLSPKNSEHDKCETFIVALYAIKQYCLGNTNISKITIKDSFRDEVASYVKYIN